MLEYITACINWNLPTKDKCLTVQELNLTPILSSSGWKSDFFVYLEDRGTPRYLIERDPWEIPIASAESLHLSLLPPSSKSSVFLLLILRPETDLNSSKIWSIPLKNSSSKKINTSSTNFVTKGAPHSGCNLKTQFIALLSKIFDKTSIVITKSKDKIESRCINHVRP